MTKIVELVWSTSNLKWGAKRMEREQTPNAIEALTRFRGKEKPDGAVFHQHKSIGRLGGKICGIYLVTK